MTEDEMVGWHHGLSGHKFEQTLGDGEGQRSLVDYNPWGHKESDTAEGLTLSYFTHRPSYPGSEEPDSCTAPPAATLCRVSNKTTVSHRSEAKPHTHHAR